jgi:hypothetical protein
MSEADLTCPVCRAGNRAGPECRRCRADLSLLFELEDDRRALLERARQEMASGHWPDALATLRAARALRDGADVRQGEVACLLLQRDFPAAWERYLALRRTSSGSGAC